MLLASLVGNRIHVIGNSSSGKSTLAARLAGALDAPLVELDAINWQPGWVGLNATDPEEFKRRPRDRAPNRCHSATSLGRHRPRWPDHPVAG